MVRPPSYADAVAEAYYAVTHIVSRSLSIESKYFKVSLFFDEVHVRFIDELSGPCADLVVAIPGLIGAIREVFSGHGVTCDGDCGWYDSRDSAGSEAVGWVACPGCPACGAEPDDRLIIVAACAELELRLREEFGASGIRS